MTGQRLCRLFGVLGLLVVLVVPVGSVSAAERIRIEIWGNQQHLMVLQPILDEFNASQDRIEAVIPGRNESPNSIIPAFAAGTPPDILQSSFRWTYQYANAGITVDLTPYIEREGGDFLADFIPKALIRDHTVYGRFHSLPVYLSITGPYYNPDLFAEAGVSAPQPGWTWGDMADMARRVQRDGPEGNKEVWGIIAEDAAAFEKIWIGMAGGVLIDDEYNVLVNSQPVRQAYSWFVDLVDRGLLTHLEAYPQYESARAHNAAFVATAIHRQQYWDAQESPMRVVPPLRQNSTSEPATSFSSRGLSIVATTPERQDAAWEVIKYILEPENNARWMIGLGAVPTRFSGVAHPVFQEGARTAQPNLLIWSDQYLDIPEVKAWPVELYQTDIRNTYRNLSRQVFAGEISIEAFIAETERQLNRFVQEYLDTL